MRPFVEHRAKGRPYKIVTSRLDLSPIQPNMCSPVGEALCISIQEEVANTLTALEADIDTLSHEAYPHDNLTPLTSHHEGSRGQ